MLSECVFWSYLYGLRNVHLVNFNMRKPASWHLFKVLIIAVKQVCCIHTHADCALKNEGMNGRD